MLCSVCMGDDAMNTQALPAGIRAIIRKREEQAMLAKCFPWPCFASENITATMVHEDDAPITIRQIVRLVALRFEVSELDICSSRRTDRLVKPRHIAMYLAKTCTNKSYPLIGREFGGRDHTTVMHAVWRIEKLIAESSSFASEIALLRARLEGGN